MAKNSDIKVLTVRLDKKIANKVDNIIQQVECSQSDFIRNAIDFYISNHRVTEVIVTKQELVKLSA